MNSRCFSAFSSGIPVVSSSSPPESHGVGIEQLGDVDPANLALGRLVSARRDLEAELGGEALDGEHLGARRVLRAAR